MRTLKPSRFGSGRHAAWVLLTGLAWGSVGFPAEEDASDWPRWRGPLGNGSAIKSPALAEEWPAWGPRKVWEDHSLPPGGNGSPAIANNRAYLYLHDKRHREERVVCLDAGTGRLRWQADFPVDRETLHEASGTPCVAGGRVYVMGARVGYCLDAANGNVVWKTDTGVPAKDPAVSGKQQEVFSSFVVEGNVAAVCAGPTFGLDARTGAERWRAPEAGGYAGAMTSVARWRSPDGVRLVYVGMDRLGCIDSASGSVLWDEPGNRVGHTYASSPAVSGDRLAVTRSKKLQAYELRLPRPRRLWSTPFLEEYSSPVIADGRVYTVGPEDASGAYTLVCRDLESGQVRWREPVEKAEYSSPIFADGKILAFANMGREIAMHDARGGARLAKAVVGAAKWTTPSIAGGRLYVRLPDGMASYDLTREACAPPAFRAEGEELPVLARRMRGSRTQKMTGFGPGWSGDAQLFLVAANGDWIEVDLAVPGAGRYELTAFLTKAPDYGIIEFAMDGKGVGGPFDGYDRRVVPSGPVSLGEVDLPKGRSVLRLQVTGKNVASKGFLAGVDAIELRER